MVCKVKGKNHDIPPSEFRRDLGRKRFVKILQIESRTRSEKLGDGTVKTKDKSRKGAEIGPVGPEKNFLF